MNNWHHLMGNQTAGAIPNQFGHSRQRMSSPVASTAVSPSFNGNVITHAVPNTPTTPGFGGDVVTHALPSPPVVSDPPPLPINPPTYVSDPPPPPIGTPTRVSDPAPPPINPPTFVSDPPPPPLVNPSVVSDPPPPALMDNNNAPQQTGVSQKPITPWGALMPQTAPAPIQRKVTPFNNQPQMMQ